MMNATEITASDNMNEFTTTSTNPS